MSKRDIFEMMLCVSAGFLTALGFDLMLEESQLWLVGFAICMVGIGIFVTILVRTMFPTKFE